MHFQNQIKTAIVRRFEGEEFMHQSLPVTTDRPSGIAAKTLWATGLGR